MRRNRTTNDILSLPAASSKLAAGGRHGASERTGRLGADRGRGGSGLVAARRGAALRRERGGRQTDELAIQIIADQVTGTTPSMELQIEHSGDGRNWSNKAAAAELTFGNGSLGVGVTNKLGALDAGTIPALGLVRIRLTLGGTSPAAHIKLNICGRDDA
jgi:hypothetical protein